MADTPTTLADDEGFTPLPEQAQPRASKAAPRADDEGFTPLPTRADREAKAAQAKTLGNTPDESYLSGTLKNIGTAGTEIAGGATSPLGMVTQLPQMAVDYARHHIEGKPFADVVRERQAREAKEKVEQAEWFQKTYGRPMPHSHTPVFVGSADKVTQAIQEHTGHHEPETELGKIGTAALTGAGAMAAMPVGGAGLKALGAGAAFGAVPAAVGEVTGRPEDAIPAMAATPFVGKAARSTPGVKQLFPKQAAQQKVKGTGVDVPDMLEGIKAKTEPNGEIKTDIPNMPQTTGEVTGQAELLRAQNAEGVGKKPTTQAYTDILNGHYRRQNLALAEHVKGTAPILADKTSAGELFRKTHDELSAKAAAANDAIPDPNKAVEGRAGQNLGADARSTAAKQRTELYNLIDPEGRLLAPPEARGKTATDALEAYKNGPRKRIMPSEVKETLEMAASHPRDMSFRDLMDFDTHINEVQSTFRRNGEASKAQWLDDLKTAVGHDIDHAVENQVNWEKQAVTRGELQPEDTFDAAVKRQRAAWFPEEAAGNLKEASGAGGSSRTSGFSGASRDGSETRSSDASGAGRTQEGNAGGDQGRPHPLEGDDYATGAPDRLAAAKEAHQELKQNFDQGPVAPHLKTYGYAGQFKGSGDLAANSMFGPGSKGGENTAAWMRIIGDHPEGLERLQNIAIGQLRDKMKDGQLTPRGLEQWKQDYAPAIAELEKKIPDFSSRFDNAALATQALNDTKGGLAGKMLHVRHDMEMEDLIGKTLGHADGLAQLDSVLPHLPVEHVEGLRRAASEWMMRKFVNTGGEFQRESLGKFLRNNEPRLERLYGETYPMIKKAGEWLAEAQENRSKQAMPTAGSQTAFLDALDPNKATVGSIGDFAVTALALEHVVGAGAGYLAIPYKIAQTLRGMGRHKADVLFKRALLDPKSMQMLYEPTKINGQLNLRAFNALANEIENETERKARASGGAVNKIDHAAEAAKLVKAVAAARKAETARTKPLLNVPDDHVAKALALANGAL